MNRPLISIVTPSFNQAPFLGEALHSVRGQHYPDLEHLVLDAASTDGTQDLLRDFQQRHPDHDLVFRSHPDAGQSAALNEGFAAAKGQIIGWLNADDRYRPECFEHIVAAFKRHPKVDVFYGDYTTIDQQGGHISLRREIEFSQFILRYFHVLYIPTTATFFRRRIFDEGHFLRQDLHYAMDLEFFLRLADAGYRLQHLPTVLADFRMHLDSKSVRFRERQRHEHRQIVLNSTPLARLIHSSRTRNTAATALQVPAALLRYSEKLMRGYYFRQRSWALFLEEQIRGVEFL